ncbi:hypothetical protein D3C86_1932780 [compost metagenome]
MFHQLIGDTTCQFGKRFLNRCCKFQSGNIGTANEPVKERETQVLRTPGYQGGEQRRPGRGVGGVGTQQ